MPRNTTFRTMRLRRSSKTIQSGMSELDNARKNFLESCCGESIVGLPGEGVTAFIDLVERRMKEYEFDTNPLLEILWERTRTPRPPGSYLVRQYEISSKVLKRLDSANAQTTIDDLVEDIFKECDVTDANRNRHENLARHLVFAVIGWSTMLYTATFVSVDADLSTSTQDLSTQPPAKQSRRPLGALLRNLGLMPIACPPGSGFPEEISPLLAVTQLNFFSLFHLGDVTIAWVDDLANHCKFDRYSKKKELRLFRLPSLCAMMCLDRSKRIVIERLFKSHSCQQGCQAKPETVASSYLVEVLLSYRLLFGQHSRSRHLFRKQELDRAKINTRADPLLTALCGNRDLAPFESIQELLRERGVYNARTNFPHLGPRLMELADYSACQRPRNLKEVWYDERDPERLLTFKAVIIVGTVSIFLSLVQVLLGIAQVVLTAVI